MLSSLLGATGRNKSLRMTERACPKHKLSFLELEDRLAPAVASVAVIPMAPMAYGSNTTMEAAVTPNPGANGTLTFYDNGALVAGASAVPIDSSGIGMFQLPSLSAGNHAITAVYNGSFGVDPSPMSAAVTQVINPVPLTITANNQTNMAGNSFSFTGNEFTATGLQNGETVGFVTFATPMGGTAATDAAGNYPIQVSAATGGTFNPNNYTITYVPGTFTLNSGTSATPTMVTLAANPTATTGGGLVTFTANVPNGTGTVTFMENGTALNGGANVPLVNGTATYSTSDLAVGNHNVTVSYSGDTNLAAGTSGAQAVTVNAASNQGQPQVVSVTPNADLTASAGNQRSSVNDLVVTFDQPVQLDPDAITLALHGNVTFDGVTQPAGYGTLPANVMVNTTDNKTYVVTFSGNTDASVNGLGSLKDGVYNLNIDASKVHAMGSTGSTMAGNYTTTFYRLFGSTGGATTPEGGTPGTDFGARITSLDNLRFRQAFNNPANYSPYFDFNGNGAIDSGDNLAFRTRFNRTMTWSMNSPTA